MYIHRSNGRFCDRVKKSYEGPVEKAQYKAYTPTGVDGAQAGISILKWEHRRQGE